LLDVQERRRRCRCSADYTEHAEQGVMSSIVATLNKTVEVGFLDVRNARHETATQRL
jgi:hypothetical protein